MKYLSLILLLMMMSVSWTFINTPDAISEDVHIGIQEDLRRVISDYINENLPSSKNLRFEKMWTEKMKDTQVKASFLYSFEDESDAIGKARVMIDGYAILNHEKTKEENVDYWSFDELYILNNHIQFKDGVTISPADGN